MSNIQYGKLPVYAPSKIYLIGDVHNEADRLISLLSQVEPLLTQEDHVVFCGDFIDRGKQPALTVATLVDFIRRSPAQVFFVQGNHESMLHHYLTTGRHDWMQFLKVTLEGWKQDWNLSDILPNTISQALLNNGFRDILERTVPYYESDLIIATHAPIDKIIAMMNGVAKYQKDYANQVPNFIYLLDRMRSEILWGFTDEGKSSIPEIDKFMVCGHQGPRSGHHPRLFKSRAFIDSGCGVKANAPVSCLVFPGKIIYQSK